jgi:ABC-type dipeptide/oligopeptide/nickel transport system permease subunit
VAFLITGLTTIIGTAIGAAAGYFGGWIDNILMRFTDLILTLPGLAILLAAAVYLDPGKPFRVALILAAIFWTGIARIVRGTFLSLREKEFVEAALMTGASDWRIIRSHLMPHLAAPIIVYSTLVVASYILAEAALSFLGVGIKLPTASWGNLLSSAPEFYTSQPWLMLWPGLAVVFTTLAFNLLGDGLRDAFDPRSKL